MRRRELGPLGLVEHFLEGKDCPSEQQVYKGMDRTPKSNWYTHALSVSTRLTLPQQTC